MTSKEANPILRANGGLHSRRALKKIEDRLQNHGMKKPILVHIVLTGSQTVQTYRNAYNEIAEELRKAGCVTEFFGCLEMDETKGLHTHIYYLIETVKKFPKQVLNVNDGEFLHSLGIKYGINRPHIAKPENPIHYSNGKKQFFARPTNGEKLDDCLQRIAYLYKNRSKEGVPCREIYFNSEWKANVAKRQTKRKTTPSLPAAALPAAEEAYEASVTGDTSTLQMANRFKACSAVHDSYGPNGASTSENSRLSIARATVRAHGSPNAASRTSSCRSAWPAREYEIRNFDMERDTPLEGAHDNSDRHDNPTRLKVATIPWKDSNMEMTAAQKYLASLYEHCVDADMDTDEIRRYLLQRGVLKTPGQVAWELENVYGFHQYAEAHPPKPVMSVQQWDRTVYRMH